MKRILAPFFLLIIVSLNISCGSKVISSSEDWKEEYGIIPNTGVLFGKFALKENWKDWKFHFYLIKEEDFFEKKYLFDFRINKQKREEELFNSKQDSINVSDSVLLIKNIPPGEYIFFTIANKINSADEKIHSGFSIFESMYCHMLKILIKKDEISLFPNIEIVPGHAQEFDNMDIHGTGLRMMRDTCSTKLEFEELNKNNYLKLIQMSKH